MFRCNKTICPRGSTPCEYEPREFSRRCSSGTACPKGEPAEFDETENSDFYCIIKGLHACETDVFAKKADQILRTQNGRVIFLMCKGDPLLQMAESYATAKDIRIYLFADEAGKKFDATWTLFAYASLHEHCGAMVFGGVKDGDGQRVMDLSLKYKVQMRFIATTP